MEHTETTLLLSDKIKYLWIYLDRAMHILARAKLRHYVQTNDLKIIYYAICQSHLQYKCQVLFLSSSNSVKKIIEKLQKKTLHMMSISRDSLLLMFKDWNVLKINAIVDLLTALYVIPSLTGLPIFFWIHILFNVVMCTMQCSFFKV